MNATATDLAAFVRAVVAAPDDDLIRLQFADWLDEHGEPERSAFIRVQCELAELWGACPPAPGTFGGAGGRVVSDDVDTRRSLLVRRQQDLFAMDWCSGWLPEALDARLTLRPFGAVDLTVGTPLARLTRGFVSQVAMRWQDWAEHADALLAACPLRGKDSLVTLTTDPDVEVWPITHGPPLIRLRKQLGMDGGGNAWVRQCPVTALLAAEWPGVRFDLPLTSPRTPPRP